MAVISLYRFTEWANDTIIKANKGFNKVEY